MEFWEYEAGLTPVQAGYVPTPTQAAYLAAPPVMVTAPPPGETKPPEAGDDLSTMPAWAARLFGTGGYGVDPLTGQPLDIAMAGIHPMAFLGPAITAGIAGLAGAMLPVGPGGEVAPTSAIAPYEPGVFPGAPVPTAVNGIPISGPGVPEPPKHMIAKAWNVKVDSKTYGTFRMYYFKLTDGRCMSYHSPTKTWKIWKPKKHIVISSNPRVKMLSKLNRLNKRVEKMLKPYQPKKPRTQMVPSRALSSIERAALK